MNTIEDRLEKLFEAMGMHEFVAAQLQELHENHQNLDTLDGAEPEALEPYTNIFNSDPENFDPENLSII